MLLLTQTCWAIRGDLVSFGADALEAALVVYTFTSTTQERVPLTFINVWQQRNTQHRQNNNYVRPLALTYLFHNFKFSNNINWVEHVGLALGKLVASTARKYLPFACFVYLPNPINNYNTRFITSLSKCPHCHKNTACIFLFQMKTLQFMRITKMQLSAIDDLKRKAECKVLWSHDGGRLICSILRSRTVNCLLIIRNLDHPYGNLGSLNWGFSKHKSGGRMILTPILRQHVCNMWVKTAKVILAYITQPKSGLLHVWHKRL